LYRPWHLVEHYRYLRFFANGIVLFLATPEEPKTVVTKLKQNAGLSTTGTTSTSFAPFVLNEHSILRGSWSLALNKVSIVLCKKIYRPATNRYGRRQANKEPIVEQEHIFRMELELSSSAKKLNNQLNWSNYEIHVSNKLANTNNITKFELNKVDFPVFYFSRVKSYSLISSMPLK
jgi:F-box protein 9